MIYTIDITTPPNTLLSSPLKSILRVTKGLVYKVEIEFPPGPCGFLYIAVFDGSYRVWPSSSDTWFHSDDKLISFDDCYLVENAPYSFSVFTFNIDDTYEHWCQVRLGVVSKEIFMARFLPSLSYKEMLEVISRLAQQQESLKMETIEQPFSWLKP